MKDDIKSVCLCVVIYLISFGIAYWLTTTQSAKDGIMIFFSGIFGAGTPVLTRMFADDSPHPKAVSTIIIAIHLIFLSYLFFVKHMYWGYGNTLTGWSIGAVLGYFFTAAEHEQLYK